MPSNSPTSKRTPITLPPAWYLRECFVYHPETGVLQWKERPREHFDLERIWLTWNTRYAWTDAGCIMAIGYRLISLTNRRYTAHRIIWKLVTGEEPPETIDHKDLNRAKNIWANLRAATSAEEIWNTRLRKTNTSGYRGVHERRDIGKWEMGIMVNGVRCRRIFNTPEEASAAREAIASELHGKFYRPPDK